MEYIFEYMKKEFRIVDKNATFNSIPMYETWQMISDQFGQKAWHFDGVILLRGEPTFERFVKSYEKMIERREER